MLLPVFSGGYTGVTVKDLREVALTRKGQDGSNLCGMIIRVNQHFFGSFQLLPPDIVADGGSNLLLEQPGQIVFVQMNMLRQILYGDAGMKMIIDIIQTLCDLYRSDRIFS